MRREITERLMRAHGVVDVLPATELEVEMRDVPVVGDHLIELLVVRAMGAFDVAVESRRTRGARGVVSLSSFIIAIGVEIFRFVMDLLP